jgi:glutathione synthase/RimK-type ligase-like ATP-grasp enzyme
VRTLIVVNEPKNWPLSIPGVELVAARQYLTSPAYSDLRGVRLFNCCRSYRYQSLGYYVSLLAAARGHRPNPSVDTIQDMKSQTQLRFVSEELDELIQKSLAPIRSGEFELSVFFGRNFARRHDRLASALFHEFPAPFLRAYFTHHDRWELTRLAPLPASEIPLEQRPFVAEVAQEYFARRPRSRRERPPRFDVAILHDPAAADAPSDERALAKFVRAAEELDLAAELVTKEDFSDLAEFDALFIRETTAVNHHTFRFAMRAETEGMVVIDDPQSILRCTNKVYLAELLERCDLPRPKTLVVHRDNVAEIVPTLGLPCVLKQPDSAFSLGVEKAKTAEEAEALAERLLERSELVIAQEWVPTEFDWRVGVLDRQPLFVCRYYMAEKHWQIVARGQDGRRRFGKVETLPVEAAPKRVVKAAIDAANLIGDGFYGVDLKEAGRRLAVIEVNDNPNVDSGVEDAVLGDELYLRVMRVLLERIERRKARRGG